MSSMLVGELVGSYRIIDPLGQGGMASVYRAYHARLDRYVAIKMMHPAFRDDSGFMIRFQREAQIVAKLEHPNIVPIYDYSDFQGQPYLVMKYIEGQTLKSQLRQGPLPLGESARILTAVAQALTYAHRMDILHRDIKPSNILMEHGYVPYLADFGLARIAASGESTLSQDMILGTPQYMSPEQAQGLRDLDARADIYSLGIVLYEMMTGHVPFNADSAYTIIHDHITVTPPLPSLSNPQVTPAIDQVILKALAKDRTDRYDSAVAFAAAFAQAVQDSGVADVSIPSASFSRDYKTIPPIPVTPPGGLPSDRGTPLTPTADRTPPFAAPVTLAIGDMPLIGRLNPDPIPTPAGAGLSISASAERSRRLHHLNRRRNLWIAGGFSGLVLTILAGLFVVVGAANDPKLQAAFLPGQPRIAVSPPFRATIGVALLPTINATPIKTAVATAAVTQNIVTLTLTASPTPQPPVTIPILSLADAETAVSQNKNDPVALFALMLAETKAHQQQMAKNHFYQAISAAGNNIPVLAGALAALAGSNQPAYAIYVAAKLVSIGNLPPDVYAETTQLLYMAASRFTVGNLGSFGNSLADLPETAEIDALTALADAQNGQMDQALPLIQKAQKLSPGLPFIMLIQGKIAEIAGNSAVAMHAFHTILSAPNSNAPSWMISQAQNELNSVAITLTAAASVTPLSSATP